MDFLAFLVPKLWPKCSKLIREIPANPLEQGWEMAARRPQHTHSHSIFSGLRKHSGNMFKSEIYSKLSQ